MKTALIEKYSTMGGTCLNVGCIPSKSLLDSSHHYENALHNFEDHGISVDGKIKLDLGKMMSRKSSVVEQTTKGLEYLMSKNDVTVYHGLGSFKDDSTIQINVDGKTQTINGKNIIIATGSNPTKLSDTIKSNNIVDSEGAIMFDSIPKHLIVIGAGIIGLELGSVWARLGSKVTILESQPDFLPFLDARVSRQVLREFNR